MTDESQVTMLGTRGPRLWQMREGSRCWWPESKNQNGWDRKWITVGQQMDRKRMGNIAFCHRFTIPLETLCHPFAICLQSVCYPLQSHTSAIRSGVSALGRAIFRHESRGTMSGTSWDTRPGGMKENKIVNSMYVWQLVQEERYKIKKICKISSNASW